MILLGPTLCLPSPATVQELFSVARDAAAIPDISLDPVLTGFLSLDSSAALQHQYAFLRRGMSEKQRATFSLNITAELGGSSRVTSGGVGVVALALSLLFDQVAQQVRADGDLSAQRFKARMIFGISRSSRIGRIIHSYLSVVPGIANDQEMMAVTSELHDNWLKLELIDHYERMTMKKRMSSVSMQQWLAGAAFHLHLRIHQVRLHSVPPGSAESLRLSYKTALSRLVPGYTTYLLRNIQETPGHQKPRTGVTDGTRNTIGRTNNTCSRNHTVNAGTSADNQTITNSLICETGEDFGHTRSDNLINGKSLSNTTGLEDVQGLLVVEPGRNVSHNVQHHPCQSPAIQQALVTRIINTQDMERNRNFFLNPEKVFQSLLRQTDDFELKR